MPLKVNTIEPGDTIPDFVPALTPKRDTVHHLFPKWPEARYPALVGMNAARLEASDELLRALASADPLAACRLLADKLRGAP